MRPRTVSLALLYLQSSSMTSGTVWVGHILSIRCPMLMSACTPLLYAYETEIMPFHLRGKGMAFSVTFGQAQAIIFQYCNPIGLANLKWKYYLVFLVFILVQSQYLITR